MVATLGLCERCSRALEAAGVPVRLRHWDIKTDYESLVAAGELSFDPHQQNSVEQLQRLQSQLAGYEPPPSPSFLGKVCHTRGIYRNTLYHFSYIPSTNTIQC